MTTAQNVELLLITISVTTLAIIAVGFLVELMILLNKVKTIAKKTDNIITNIEEATHNIKEVTKNASSKHSFMNILGKVFNNSKED